MKTLPFLIMLGMLARGAEAQHPQTGQDSTVAHLDSMVERLGRSFIRDQHAVGLSIGVYANGEGRFYNFGASVEGGANPPTEHTIFEIGSITKTFVSLVLANAVLEGRVHLEDDIRTYLKGAYPNLEHDGTPIRVVHLANTTSSLPDWLPTLPPGMQGLSPDSALRVKIEYYKNLSRTDFLQALHAVRLDTTPGSRQRHSNAGAQLLAYILEDVYGTPIDDLIRRYVTQPRGMTRTYFLRPGENADLARGYKASGTDAAYEFVMPYFRYAGGLGSTTEDLIKYIRYFLDRSNAVVRLSLKKTVDVDVSSARVVSTTPNELPSPAVYSVALNWLEYQPSASELQIWSDGGTSGFNAYLVIYPLASSGVVLLANKSDERIFKALPGLAQTISRAIGPH